ncbi:MAG: acetylornithine/succinylornithine family transaminase [Firmicutes bacterium]|nr:acetylornithine/succinylornithine family transaminase [Bacillota bacterium]
MSLNYQQVLLEDIRAADKKYMLQNYGERDLFLVRGQGSYVWDAEGKQYLDCVSGIAVNAFGHCYPPIVEAIRAQLDRFLHISNLYLIETQQTLAALLVENTGLDRVFFCNSGTEANEGAIKFARKYWFEQGQPERYEIITFHNSFHGRTYAAMAATGQEKFRQGFGPMPEGFINLPVNDVPLLEDAVSERTAAVLIEPILAEGGIISVSQEFANALAHLQERGVLLITDEIQVGLGRTGDFLASSALHLRPDLVTLAKPLGGGLPLGAVLMREKVAATIHSGDHGTTFGGNPVACAAGVAVVRELTKPGFLDSVKERSQYLRAKLGELLQTGTPQGLCGPLLGKGFILGFRFAGDLSGLIKECRNNGLLVHRAGRDVVRLLPPLNISYPEMDELVERLGKSLNSKSLNK